MIIFCETDSLVRSFLHARREQMIRLLEAALGGLGGLVGFDLVLGTPEDKAIQAMIQPTQAPLGLFGGFAQGQIFLLDRRDHVSRRLLLSKSCTVTLAERTSKAPSLDSKPSPIVRLGDCPQQINCI